MDWNVAAPAWCLAETRRVENNSQVPVHRSRVYLNRLALSVAAHNRSIPLGKWQERGRAQRATLEV